MKPCVRFWGSWTQGWPLICRLVLCLGASYLLPEIYLYKQYCFTPADHLLLVVYNQRVIIPRHQSVLCSNYPTDVTQKAIPLCPRSIYSTKLGSQRTLAYRTPCLLEICGCEPTASHCTPLRLDLDKNASIPRHRDCSSCVLHLENEVVDLAETVVLVPDLLAALFLGW